MIETNDNEEELRFGACPHCHQMHEYLNVGRDHYGLCNEHKVAWNFGANLFSSWQDETQEDWDRNLARLRAGYREVEPHYDARQRVLPWLAA